MEPFKTLVVEFAERVGAKVIVKGLRAISDFEYELEMNQLNRQQAPQIESMYLMASPKYSFLSSSGVKELAIFGGEIDNLVPPAVASACRRSFSVDENDASAGTDAARERRIARWMSWY